MKRLLTKMQEMNLEYKCQKTQVETLEKFNDSLNAQIKRLEHQLFETQSVGIQKQKTSIGELTPRQLSIQRRVV